MSRWSGKGRWRLPPTVSLGLSVDNGKSSGHNATLDANERIHTTSNSASLSLIQRMRHHWGPFTPETAPKAGTHDMARAFRQIPVADAHLGLSVVAAWDPGTRGWRFGVASPTKALQSSMCSNNSCFLFCLLICLRNLFAKQITSGNLWDLAPRCSLWIGLWLGGCCVTI